MPKKLLRTMKRSFSSLTITNHSTTLDNSFISTPRCTTIVDSRTRTSTLTSSQIPILKNTQTPIPLLVPTKDTSSSASLVTSRNLRKDESYIVSVEYNCPKCKATRDTQVYLIELLWFSTPCNHYYHDVDNSSSTDSDGEIVCHPELSGEICNDPSNPEYPVCNYESEHPEPSDSQSRVTEDESEA